MPQVLINGKWTELKSLGNGEFSAGNRLFKISHLPTSIIGKNKEFVVTPEGSAIKDKPKPKVEYRSAYNPDDIIKGFNALTLGGLNNLSPTLWARRTYDTGKLLTGNMTWSGYTDSWINGNNGVVSLNFKEEHPILSNSINGGIDLATFSLPKVSLYPVHFVLLVATPITGSYIGAKLGEEVDKYLPKKIQGYGGMLGYMLGGGAGMGALYKNYSNTPLIHTKYKKLNDVINYPITTTAATVKGKYPWTKKQDIRLKRQLFDDIEEARNFLLKSGYSLEDLPAIRIAKKSLYLEGELGHYTPYYNTITVKSTINPYSNLPIESLESVGSGFKGLVNHELTHGRLEYFGALSEFDPKAGYYVLRKDIKTPIFDPFRKKKAGSWTASPDEFDAELSNLLISTGKLPTEPVDNIFPLQTRFDIWDKNKARKIEDLILLLRKNQEFFKDGGKMNIIEFLKNGSGIHIKEKNKGKFTKSAKAAGLSVQEHAKSVLNDPNATPLLKKRANFARNAAKWKHKEGGIIKAQEGTKTSWWLKAGNFLNSDAGKGILNLGSSLISGIGNSSKAIDYGQEFDNATNATVLAMLKKQYAKNKNLGMQYALLYINYLNQMNSDQHFGEIDKQMLSELFAKLLVDEDDINEYKLLRALEKALLMLAIQGSGFGDVLSQGVGLLGNYLGNKKTTNSITQYLLSNNSTIGKSTNPYMNTNLGGFVNNPTNKFFWAPSVKD